MFVAVLNNRMLLGSAASRQAVQNENGSPCYMLFRGNLLFPSAAYFSCLKLNSSSARRALSRSGAVSSANISGIL